MTKLLGGGAIIGIVAGIVLGFLLKCIQAVTDVKVYTLLLNVDYIPIFKEFHFPEWIEFAFHLIISIFIGIVLLYCVYRFSWDKEAILKNSMIISVVLAIILYPTTLLSQQTPAFLSVSAFLYWCLGHMVYGFVLGGLLNLLKTVYFKNTEKSY